MRALFNHNAENNIPFLTLKSALEQNKIVIKGLGFSDQDILKLISNLNNKKLIKQATLANMSLPKASSGSPSMKGFKVVCLLESS